MIIKSLSLLLILLTSSLWKSALGQNPGSIESTSIPDAVQFQSVFNDDFSTDTRADYSNAGQVLWRPGTLALTERSAVKRDIDGGAWARVAIKLNSAAPGAKDEPAELRIWFLLKDVPPCFVRIGQHPAAEGPNGSVALLRTTSQNEQLTQFVVREQLVEDEELRELIVEYSYGLVKVFLGDKPLLIAHIDYGDAAIAALAIESVVGTHDIISLSTLVYAPPGNMSPEQHKQLSDARAENQRAFELHAEGRFGEALQTMERVREVRRQLLGARHPDYATSLNNLAAMYIEFGDQSRPEGLFLEAKFVYEKSLGMQHPLYANLLNNLSMFYADLGECGRADALYQQALAVYRSTFDDKSPAYTATLNNLAAMYSELGDYARAEPLYKEALEVDKAVRGEQDPTYWTGLNNLGRLYQDMHDFARSEPLYRRATEIRRSLLGEKHPDYGHSLNNLAGLSLLTGDVVRAGELYAKSHEILRAALGNDHPDIAASLDCLADLHSIEGDFPRAERLHRDVLRLRLTAAAKTLPALSEAQARKWMSMNSPRADRFLSALRRLGTKDSVEAYSAVWNTKALTSRLRVGQSLSDNSSPQARVVFAQLRDARLTLAGFVSARPAPEQVADYRNALATANDRKEVLEKRLAERNPASKREVTIRDASIENLLQRLPRGVAVVDLVQLNDWEFVDQEISLMKEDGVTETRAVKKGRATPIYDAFVLRSYREDGGNPARWIPLGAAEPIDLAVSRFREQLAGNIIASVSGRNPEQADTGGQPSPESSVDPSMTLRQLIWDKLEPELDGCHTVILMPDGGLHRLAWGALPGRRPGTFLLEDYALATAAYGQQLFGLLADAAIAGNPQLLVAGGIRYDERPEGLPIPSVDGIGSLLATASRSVHLSADDRTWSYLTGAEQEARTVCRLWSDRGPMTFLAGTQAHEHAIAAILPQYRFIHLATHGFFDKSADVFPVNLREQSLFQTEPGRSQRGDTVAARNPLLMAGIVLSGANIEPEKDDLGLPVGSDGILTSEEIPGLDLHNTELVTLSACETGLGDVANGEGVYGLARALHQAGARSVVASLWKVDDRATQELMTQFYTNLWVKKQSKIDALRNAQLFLLRNPVLPDGTRLTRGDINKAKPVVPDPATTRDATDPYFWAAWTLSGDWR